MHILQGARVTTSNKGLLYRQIIWTGKPAYMEKQKINLDKHLK